MQIVRFGSPTIPRGLKISNLHSDDFDFKVSGGTMNVVAMIPGRMGSERLAMKNLALLNGKPLIYYALMAAKSSGVFDRVILNSDGEVFRNIAEECEVEFYLRPAPLGSSETKSDEVVYDFMQ